MFDKELFKKQRNIINVKWIFSDNGNVKKVLMHKRMCINYLEDFFTYDILFSKDAVYCGLTLYEIIGLILNPLLKSIGSLVLLG